MEHLWNMFNETGSEHYGTHPHMGCSIVPCLWANLGHGGGVLVPPHTQIIIRQNGKNIWMIKS